MIKRAVFNAELYSYVLHLIQNIFFSTFQKSLIINCRDKLFLGHDQYFSSSDFWGLPGNVTLIKSMCRPVSSKSVSNISNYRTLTRHMLLANILYAYAPSCSATSDKVKLNTQDNW